MLNHRLHYSIQCVNIQSRGKPYKCIRRIPNTRVTRNFPERGKMQTLLSQNVNVNRLSYTWHPLKYWIYKINLTVRLLRYTYVFKNQYLQYTQRRERWLFTIQRPENSTISSRISFYLASINWRLSPPILSWIIFCNATWNKHIRAEILTAGRFIWSTRKISGCSSQK